MKKTIWYAGEELEFVQEVPDDPKELDALQAMIDWFKKYGRSACATHEGGKHQLYAAPEHKALAKAAYGLVKKAKAVDKAAGFKAVYEEAVAAGKAALIKCVPVPMVVQTHSDMLDDGSPVVKSEYVGGGVCGFAWINLSPATSAFAKWLKAKGIGSKGYYGGLEVWISEGGQSMAKKEAYAHAFAGVLVKYGYNAHAQSRMD